MNPADRPAARLTAPGRWPTVAVDATAGAALFLATLGPGQVLSGPSWLLALQTALVAPLAWRRRAPMTVLAAIGLAAAVQWALDVQLPADAALLVALYTVAAHRPWRHALLAALALQAGILLAAARWAPPGQFPFTVAALSAMAAAALMTGLWTRERRAYVTSLERDREQRARLAVAEERARMTRDMHDIVTHNLSVMVALADSAAHVRHSAPDRAAAAMEHIAVTGRQALEDMRRSLSTGHDFAASRDLTTSSDGLAISSDGLAASHELAASGVVVTSGGDSLDAMRQPAPGIADLGPLAERMRAAGLATRLRVTGDAEAVPAAAQLTIYRLVQEALTNTLRHAPTTGADVRVDVSARRAEVEVIDVPGLVAPADTGPRDTGPGDTGLRDKGPRDPRPRGSGPRSGLRGEGRGIAGMRERVAAYGGTLDAGPVAGGGWRVLAVLDLRPPR
ncbi:sensor histidine kinase [Nonomuraea roseoviolacea]|uniref:histidine kinase n=1 Tax=Nonomuraea roseoviolacea subsp. carminata TaxID=160689 RepID=A0ABT1K816_9ACTN|nr:histidine kinase [Nonomuraea roseoviolacea]MCP2350146.1 signal transduction histidine kinase [Nonomuraea roseoviolacea subsp. carminata]